jgi:hypothetical protein
VGSKMICGICGYKRNTDPCEECSKKLEQRKEVEKHLDIILEEFPKVQEFSYQTDISYLDELLFHMKDILTSIRNEPDGYGGRYDAQYLIKQIIQESEYLNDWAKLLEPRLKLVG